MIAMALFAVEIFRPQDRFVGEASPLNRLGIVDQVVEHADKELIGLTRRVKIGDVLNALTAKFKSNKPRVDIEYRSDTISEVVDDVLCVVRKAKKSELPPI